MTFAASSRSPVSTDDTDAGDPLTFPLAPPASHSSVIQLTNPERGHRKCSRGTETRQSYFSPAVSQPQSAAIYISLDICAVKSGPTVKKKKKRGALLLFSV